jgi:hypothetical protein
LKFPAVDAQIKLLSMNADEELQSVARFTVAAVSSEKLIHPRRNLHENEVSDESHNCLLTYHSKHHQINIIKITANIFNGKIQ